jgi:predicted neuraminidase
MNPLARSILMVLVVLACLPPVVTSWQEKGKTGQRVFVIPSPAGEAETAPDFKAELITPGPVAPSVHVASVCEGPDGRLNAAWYGGSREGAADVDIFWSQREPGADKPWSKPRALVSRDSAMRELRRPIKKVGNAVLFANGAGQLRLIYVTVSLGGWSTSSLNVKTSRDAGQTWGNSQRLTLSPFFNFSELVKNNPAGLSDGGWAVPIYHEFLAKFPEILWMRETAGGGLSWSKTRLFGGHSALQPALVPLDQRAAIVLCRDSSAMRRIQVSRSTDLGMNWSPPQSLTLPNCDSGLDALRLFDGRMLLAFNDSPTGRDNLSLALSDDGGLNWSRRAILESEPGAEFSYPYLIQARDGRVHLVYTWKRKAIKYAAFNLAWLDTQAKSGPGGAK